MSAHPQLEKLLLDWQTRRENNSFITLEDICRDCPELLAELRERIEALRSMQKCASDDRALMSTHEYRSLASTSDGQPLAASREPMSPSASSASLSKPGRFTVLRPHARGGLGQVSLARDEKLRRQVALKEIRADLAGDARVRQRFLNEAEITGQLEHPGIVPVYALDEDNSGQPYYAMRFIQGQTFAEAIRAYHTQPTPLVFRDLLQRFVSVCQTIGFAHSKQVIHRDLKPANIMLGDYGETLVVDWGLAKVLSAGGQASPADSDSTSAAGDVRASSDELASTDFPDSATDVQDVRESPALTAMGAVLGTPAYMSPEQAMGRSHEVGPAADIYALGAILYELLSGSRPYAGSGGAQAVLESLQRGNAPTRPSQLNRHVPRPMEAICRKAMSPAIADRYSAATEVAAEVDRYLADEPVIAWSEPLLVRVRRWMRRHQTAVTTGVATVAVLVVCLTTLVVLVSGKNRELNLANGNLVTANHREATERERATRGEASAEERYQIAVKTLNDVIYAVDRELETRPGTSDVRKKLLTKASADLRALLNSTGKENVPDPALICAHYMMGKIASQVDGDSKRAMAEYEAGWKMASALHEAQPRNTVAIDWKCMTLHRIALLNHEQGENKLALDQLRSVVETAEAWRNMGAGLTAPLYELEDAWLAIGDLAREQGDLQESIAAYEKSLEFGRQYAVARPDDLHAERSLAIVVGKLAQVLEDRDDLAGALKHAREAVAIQRKVVQRDPGYHRGGIGLLNALTKLAILCDAIGESDKAETAAQEAYELGSRLHALDPADWEIARNLSSCCITMGSIAAYNRRNYAAAIEHYKRAKSLLESNSSTAASNDHETEREKGQVLRSLGFVYELLGDTEKARESHRASVALWRTAVKRYPDFIDIRYYLSMELAALAELEEAAVSLELADEGLMLFDPVPRETLATSEWLNARGLMYMTRGRALQRQGKLLAAAGEFAKGTALGAQATAASPAKMMNTFREEWSDAAAKRKTTVEAAKSNEPGNQQPQPNK